MSSHSPNSNLSQTYTEILCIPTDCYEVFVDFIIQITGLAIEEVATSTLSNAALDEQLQFVNVPSDRANITSVVRDFATQACIIRYDPSATLLCEYVGVDNADMQIDSAYSNGVDSSPISDMTLLQALKSFACVLSKRLGREVGFAYTLSHKHNQDWIALYQAGVMPLECGKYYIHPSWHAPKNDKQNIIIDPALAFGSGHHASTFMCISLLSVMDLRGKHCLDVGCGSGILGIIMAKQGGIVSACDVDMLAVEETGKNFAQNGVAPRAIWLGSLANSLESTESNTDSSSYNARAESLQESGYDVICANIVADVLACMHRDFIKALKPSGVLILSGILAEKCEWILDIFSDMQLLQKEQKDEWVSLKLARVT